MITKHQDRPAHSISFKPDDVIKKPLQVAIIGGGPSGLQAAANWAQEGANVTIFERHTELGGTWCYARNENLRKHSDIANVKPFLPDEISPVYKDLRTNVPIQAMSFEGFALPNENTLRFGTRNEVQDYLLAFSSDLLAANPDTVSFRLGTTVTSVTRDSTWRVASLDALGERMTDEFDVVVVAIGPFHKPKGDDLHDPEFPGLCIHSAYYDDPAIFSGKSVLIVGCHNSGRDIFWDAMALANRVAIACPSEEDKFNLVYSDELDAELSKKFVSIGRVTEITKEASVRYLDWSGQERLSNTIKPDIVVYCTGYDREFPFLGADLQPATFGPDRQEVSNCFLFTAHKDYPSSLFFFHPTKSRTPFNTMSRDTWAQAKMMVALASSTSISLAHLQALDEELNQALAHVYEVWFQQSINTCPCAVQNPLFMTFLDAVADNLKKISASQTPGKLALQLAHVRMKALKFRKDNAIWHSGMELRGRADTVNRNRFRVMTGKVTAGPEVDGADLYEVTWYHETGEEFLVFSEADIRHQSLIAGT